MKRIFSAILATLMLSTAAVATVSAAAKVEGKLTCEAYVSDITVDGKIEDAWKYANSYDVNYPKTYVKDFYKDTMKAGVDYADMDVKVLWNGKNTLYVLCMVKDKTPHKESSTSWQNDGVEIFTQMENSTNASATKTQYRIYDDGSEPLSAKVLAASTAKTADGWTLEVAIDVSKAGGAGQYLGIDFQYNDAVLGNQKRQVCLGWSDKEDKASKDPSVYGQCLLSAKKVADIKAAAQTTAATTKAPAAKPTAPATFDAGILMAVAAAASCAGVVVSKKRK